MATQPIEPTPQAQMTPVQNIETNLETIKEKLDPKKYNPIMHSQAVIESLPNGVTLIPYVVSIPPHERYTKDVKDGNKTAGFLDGDDAMLAHTAIKRIGRSAGIQLKRTIDEFIQVPDKNGVVQTFLRLEYEASMMLPDGEMITETGGKEELYGGAHCREKIDSKAKRNAIRALLNIPITIPKKDMEKPFVIFKATYDPSAGGIALKMYEAIQAKKEASIAQLYGSTVEPEAIDVQAEPTPNPVDIAPIFEEIKATTNKQALNLVIEKIKGMTLPEDQKDELRKTVLSHSKFLAEVSAQEQAGF